MRATVAQRIGRRAAAPGWPEKIGGLHVFLLVYPLTNWEGILSTALSAFGKVTTFEWRSRGFDDTAPNWVEVRDSMSSALLDAFHAARRENGPWT